MDEAGCKGCSGRGEGRASAHARGVVRMRGRCVPGLHFFSPRRSGRPREPNAHARRLLRVRGGLVRVRGGSCACAEGLFWVSIFFAKRSVRLREPNELVWTGRGSGTGAACSFPVLVMRLEPARLPGSRSLASAPPEVALLLLGWEVGVASHIGVHCCSHSFTSFLPSGPSAAPGPSDVLSKPGPASFRAPTLSRHSSANR